MSLSGLQRTILCTRGGVAPRNKQCTHVQWALHCNPFQEAATREAIAVGRLVGIMV